MATVVDLSVVRAARQSAAPPIPDNQGRMLLKTLASIHRDSETLERMMAEWRNTLIKVADRCADARVRLAACQRFHMACREAWELNDLNEMIRRRDQLAAQLPTRQKV